MCPATDYLLQPPLKLDVARCFNSGQRDAGIRVGWDFWEGYLKEADSTVRAAFASPQLPLCLLNMQHTGTIARTAEVI